MRRSTVLRVVVAVGATAGITWLAAWWGCTGHDPYRRTRDVASVSTSVEALASVAGEQLRVAGSSVEKHPSFSVATIEFDDQGEAHDSRQIEAAVAEIAAAVNQGAIVLVFAHGWKHDGRVCDGNMCCLREVLRYLAEAEPVHPDQPPRKVIGVYLAWRGASTRSWPAEELTFWERKRVAHRIGEDGDLSSILFRLAGAYRDLKASNPDGRSRMVVVGHSFGAALIYSAVGSALRSSFGRYLEVDDGRCRDERQPLYGIGDLVVLVNPAFETAKYRSLASMAAEAKEFCPSQTPLLLVVTSRADWATAVAFPFGRTLDTLFDHFRSASQRDLARHALGHDPASVTHDLVVVAGAGTAEPAMDQAACACEHRLGAFSLERQRQLIVDCGEKRDFRELDMAGTRCYGGSRLVRRESLQLRAHAPFIVAQTNEHLIADHNDLFNKQFIDFLVGFVAATDYKKAAWQQDHR